MTELTAGEQETLEAVFQGLAIAVSRYGELDADALSKTSETKIEKYIYQALAANDDLDRVTHSWYLAGAKADTPNNRYGKVTLRETFNSTFATIEDSEGFVDNRPTKDFDDPRVSQYADFFIKEFNLEDAWFTNSKTFLLDFYEREAPEEFRDLYLSCQKLRMKLDRARGEIKGRMSDSPGDTKLSDFGTNSTVSGPDFYEEVANLVSEIHVEMAKHKDLREVLPEYRAFTDILEDAFLALSQTSVDRLDDSQLQVFGKLRRFHYYEAWKLPSLVISIQTATGPRADDLKLRRVRELESHRQSYLDDLDSLQNAAAEAALVPTNADYPSVAEENELINEFVRQYSLDL